MNPLRWLGAEVESLGTIFFSVVFEIPRVFFDHANSLVEPMVRSGWALPGRRGVGLVVLKVVGRSSHRRIPLFGILFADNHVLVATGRGTRSQWVRRLEGASRVRYWIGGRRLDGRAVVFPARGSAPRHVALPATCAWAVSLLAPMRRFGWAYAVLCPTRSSHGRPGDAWSMP
jgi:hypothetical protein